MTKVFNDVPGGSLLDTPVNVPSWTVQSPQTGSNQSLVSSAGAGVNSGQAIGYTSEAAPAPTGTEATDILNLVNVLKASGVLH